MKKRLLLAFCLGLFFMPLLHAQNGKEPGYKGKPLSQWLQNWDWASSQWFPPLHEEQEEALRHIGTNAMPFLVQMLLDPQKFDSGPGGYKIIQAFRFLGPLGRSAIPELVNMITNTPEVFPTGTSIPSNTHEFMLALGGISKDALPALLNLLTNSLSPGRKLDAIQAITDMGTNGFAALPVLMQFVNDTNDMVALDAVKAVGRVGAGTPEGLKALREIMKLPGRFHRDYRYAALDEMGNYGKACLPDVIAALDTENFWRAYLLLTRVAPEALTNHAVLQSAAKRLRLEDISERENAALLLQAAGQVARGEKPDSFGQLNMEPAFRNATNTLLLLAPELLKDNADSQVPH